MQKICLFILICNAMLVFNNPLNFIRRTQFSSPMEFDSTFTSGDLENTWYLRLRSTSLSLFVVLSQRSNEIWVITANTSIAGQCDIDITYEISGIEFSQEGEMNHLYNTSIPIYRLSFISNQIGLNFENMLSTLVYQEASTTIVIIGKEQGILFERYRVWVLSTSSTDSLSTATYTAINDLDLGFTTDDLHVVEHDTV